MNRLKFNPQMTSFDFVKFRVEKGTSDRRVQPSRVMRASDIQTPSQPESKSVPSDPLCSSDDQAVALCSQGD